MLSHTVRMTVGSSQFICLKKDSALMHNQSLTLADFVEPLIEQLEHNPSEEVIEAYLGSLPPSAAEFLPQISECARIALALMDNGAHGEQEGHQSFLQIKLKTVTMELPSQKVHVHLEAR